MDKAAWDAHRIFQGKQFIMLAVDQDIIEIMLDHQLNHLLSQVGVVMDLPAKHHA